LFLNSLIKLLNLIEFILRIKQTIKFELKDFNSIYNQNKESIGIESAKYKYGIYNWSLSSCVKKYKNQVDGELWFVINLHCESNNQANFPLFANVKLFILNRDKDSRKDLQGCNLY
jgi:hypothetical protein